MQKERKQNVKNKKLRIAVLGHKRIPSREGGIEIVVEELSVRMAKLGHQVTIYNRSGHHVSGKEFDAHRLKEYKYCINTFYGDYFSDDDEKKLKTVNFDFINWLNLYSGTLKYKEEYEKLADIVFK